MVCGKDGHTPHNGKGVVVQLEGSERERARAHESDGNTRAGKRVSGKGEPMNEYARLACGSCWLTFTAYTAARNCTRTPSPAHSTHAHRGALFFALSEDIARGP